MINSPKFHFRVWPTLMAIVMFITLCGLGTWQLQRLTWKENLIVQGAARLEAQAKPFEAQMLEKPDALYYQPVVLAHSVTAAQPFSIFRRGGENEELGYQIYIPASFDDKNWFLIKSIFSQQESAPYRFDLPEIVQGEGLFVPFNSFDALLNVMPKDMEITSVHVKKIQKGDVRPILFIPLEGLSDADKKSTLAAIKSIPNNHLSYAVFWFLLAFILLIIYLRFSIQK